MKLKAFIIVGLLSLTASAFAGLQKLSESELSDTAISIFPEGMNEELAKSLLVGVTLNDTQKIAFIKQVNSLLHGVNLGEITESNFMGYYLNHLDKMARLGIPSEILLSQADAVLRAQREAELAAQKLEMQRAIFQRLVSELSNLANSVRVNPNAPIVINLDYILGGTKEINIPGIRK